MKPSKNKLWTTEAKKTCKNNQFFFVVDYVYIFLHLILKSCSKCAQNFSHFSCSFWSQKPTIRLEAWHLHIQPQKQVFVCKKSSICYREKSPKKLTALWNSSNGCGFWQRKKKKERFQKRLFDTILTRWNHNKMSFEHKTKKKMNELLIF